MNANMTDDWRLQGQERYLTGVTLVHRAWRQTRPNWRNHDHCAFCWATIADHDGPGILREGWTTLDDYHWICDQCFADFRERFSWQIADDSN
jgi:hypothetical protein